jgi:RNA polymerase sigma-70 factor (ECF subfamily)
MTRLALGDNSALADLYRRHRGMVRSALARFAMGVTDAELDELTQDVFLAVAESAGSYSDRARFRAWLYSIAARRARKWRRRSWFRRRVRRKHGSECSGVAQPRQLSVASRMALREEALRLLGRLSTGQREVLWLSAVEGFTGEEIAQILGVSPNTVWTRLHRARCAMAEGVQRMREVHGEEEEPS